MVLKLDDYTGYAARNLYFGTDRSGELRWVLNKETNEVVEIPKYHFYDRRKPYDSTFDPDI